MHNRRPSSLAPASDERVPVRAPHVPADASLAAEIARLRSAGEIVIVDLPGNDEQAAGDRTLARIDGHWKIMAAAAPAVSNSD